MNRATNETERCRMLRSDDTRCPNAALPRGDDTEAAVCSVHAAKILRLVSGTEDRQLYRQLLARKTG